MNKTQQEKERPKIIHESYTLSAMETTKMQQPEALPYTHLVSRMGPREGLVFNPSSDFDVAHARQRCSNRVLTFGACSVPPQDVRTMRGNVFTTPHPEVANLLVPMIFNGGRKHSQEGLFLNSAFIGPALRQQLLNREKFPCSPRAPSPPTLQVHLSIRNACSHSAAWFHGPSRTDRSN